MVSRGQRQRQRQKSETPNAKNFTKTLSKYTPAFPRPKRSNKPPPPSPRRLPGAGSKGKENIPNDREAVPVEEVEQTSGPLSPVKKNIKLFIQGPVGNEGLASFSDPILVDLLELIGQRYHVQIENGMPFPGCLLVCGTQISPVEMAHRDICGLMRRLGSYVPQRAIWMQHARSVDDMLLDNPEPLVQLIGMEISPGDASLSRTDLQAEKFQDHFSKAADIIRAVPDRLRMQLEFGRLLVDITNDDHLSELWGCHNLETSLSMLAARGATIFDRRIGGESFFFALREKVLRDAKDGFYPCSPITEELGDIQPERFLLIGTEGFLIELDVASPVSSSRKGPQGLSLMRVFQRRLSESNVDTTAVCRDCHLDWNLGILQEIDAEDIPPAIKSIASNVTVQYPANGGNFPVPIFSVGFAQANRIKNVTGKMTWTVGCKGTRYKMELALSREWSVPEDTDTPVWSTGIALRCDSWDEFLGQKNEPRYSRNLDQSLKELFAPEGTKNGVNDFLAVTREILALSESVLSIDDGEEDKALIRLPQAGPLQHLNRRVVDVDGFANLLATMPAKATKKALPALLEAGPSLEQDAGVQADDDLIMFD